MTHGFNVKATLVLRRIPTALAMLFVAVAYVFFASYGTFEFRRTKWDYKTEKPGEGYYSSLAEGFRNGHLSMMDKPDPILKAVYDPYRPEVRDKYGAPYLWDASYFEGKYHLYFSPLPVLLFYLPFRWLSGGYPLDSRTNLGVLLLITAFVLPLRTWRTSWKQLLACFIPLALTALSLAAYNYARFRDVRETGITYQLTFVPMRSCRRCSLRTIPEGIRVINNSVHYLVWPPHMYSRFPYVDLDGARLDGAVSFPNVVEPIAGILPLNPVVAIGCIVTLLLIPRRRTLDVHARDGLRLMIGAWLVLAVLTTCWYIVVRYSIDFWMLMVLATAIMIEYGFTNLQDAGFGIRPLRVLTIALAFYSILFCSLLGFKGNQDAFGRGNPKLLEALQKQLNAS